MLNIAIILASSIIFELIQLFTGFGGCDASDVVCNLLGGVSGLLIYKIFRPRISDKNVNRVAFFTIIIFLPAVFYAVINSAIHWELYLIY